VVLVAAGLVVASFFSYVDYHGAKKPLTSLRLIAAPVLFVGALFTVLGGLYSQDPGEVVVVKGPGGNIVRTDDSAGWGFTVPWNSRIGFNIRNQRIEMTTDEGGNGADGPHIPSPLKNGSNADVSAVVVYSIQPSGVEDIYREQKGQDQLVENVLKPDIWTAVRDVTAEYEPFAVKQRRAEITTEVLEILTDKWEKIGVTVNDVNIGAVVLDQGTEEALTALNERQVQAEAARADLERAQIDAQTTKTEAQAQADADQIIRCGASIKTETQEVAGQETEVVVVSPKVGAACENRLNEQVLISKYIDALRAIGEQGNMIVVPQGTDISAFLNQAQPAPAG
jgi:regulator of protease activity HflC (stomatin/prohibitin superfamily)